MNSTSDAVIVKTASKPPDWKNGLPTMEDVGGAEWSQIAWHVIWSSLALLGSYIGSRLLHPHVQGMNDLDPIKIGIREWIGLLDEPPINTFFERKLQWIQLIFSLITVILWVYKSYAWTVAEDVYWLELCMCLYYIFAYFLEQLRFQFSPGHVLAVNSLIDVYTIVPLLLQGGLTCETSVFVCPTSIWMTFSYLRIIRVLQTWQDIEASGALDNVDEFKRGLALSCVRFVVIVIVLAGTMYILETLGEIEGFADLKMTTAMGETSFFVVAYYTFVTISTVGYGDFAPKTVLGRIFVIVVILGGVVFFSLETTNLIDIINLSKLGKGRFTPRNPKRRHVLVIGGGVTEGPISVIESFLKSLTDQSHGDDVPEIIVLASQKPDDQLVALLKSRWAVRAHVVYLWGNCAASTDLKRARIDNVELCFVLADVNAQNPEAEDLQNILRAAAVYRQYGTPLLVMLLEARNIPYALQAGIPARMCVAMDSLEVAFLASSCQCLGLSTMLLNLALPDLGSFPEDPNPKDMWMLEYMKGANKELYGLQLKKNFNGMDFSKAASQLYDESGVILIAAQDHTGEVVMNPGTKFIVQESSVFFCIANDEDSLDNVRRTMGRDWLRAYEDNRTAVLAKRELVRKREAAKLARPGLLALRDEKDILMDEDADGENPSTSKKVGNRNSASNVKSPTAIAGSKLVGPGLVGKVQVSLKGVRPQKEEKKKVQQQVEEETSHDTLFEHEEIASDEDERKLIVEGGSHIVLVGMCGGGGTLLPQLTALVKQLRTPFLPNGFLSVPIVILYDYRITEKVSKFFKGFPQVIYVHGSPLKLRSLLKVGADTCSKMLILSASNGSHAEGIISDLNPLLLLSMLESQEPLWGRLPQCICQLSVPHNIKQVTEQLASDRKWAAISLSQRQAQDPKDTNTSSDETDESKKKKKEAKLWAADSSKLVRRHMRYASGAIIHRAEFSSLVAAAYYTPGVLDLIGSMCQPPRSPTASIIWKIPTTPEMGGKVFKDIFHEMVSIDAIPIGLQRQARPSIGSFHPIVYTCPDPDAVIDLGDAVYVLASTDWTHKHKQYTDSFHVSYELLVAKESTKTPRATSSNDMDTALPEVKVGPMRCPMEHKLKQITTPEDGWGCDVCAADGLASGTMMHGCRKCRWVCCTDCFTAGSGPEVAEAAKPEEPGKSNASRQQQQQGQGAEEKVGEEAVSQKDAASQPTSQVADVELSERLAGPIQAPKQATNTNNDSFLGLGAVQGLWNTASMGVLNGRSALSETRKSSSASNS